MVRGSRTLQRGFGGSLIIDCIQDNCTLDSCTNIKVELGFLKWAFSVTTADGRVES
jgi:hypothetical protein